VAIEMERESIARAPYLTLHYFMDKQGWHTPLPGIQCKDGTHLCLEYSAVSTWIRKDGTTSACNTVLYLPSGRTYSGYCKSSATT